MQVVLFDIDGTLLATGGAGKAAFERALVEQFHLDTAAENIPFSGRTDRAIVADFFTAHDIENTEAHWQQFLTAYLAHLEQTLQEIEGQVLPGITALVEHLLGHDAVHLGLLTGNTEQGAQQKLQYYGLADHFAFGGFGDHHLDRDDVAREALAKARQQTGIDFQGRDAWVIGDTPSDVRCARAIGAGAVAVVTGWHTREELANSQPDLLLDDLADAAPLLRAMGLSA